MYSTQTLDLGTRLKPLKGRSHDCPLGGSVRGRVSCDKVSKSLININLSLNSTIDKCTVSVPIFKAKIVGIIFFFISILLFKRLS